MNEKNELPGQPWTENFGNKLLLRNITNDDLIEAVPVDLAGDGKFVRLSIGSSEKEWKHAGRYEIMQVLESGALEKLEAAHREAVGALEMNAQIIKDLESRAESLANELNGERTAKDSYVAYIEKAHAKRNEATAGFESERAAHDETKRVLADVTTDRDNALGALDLERAAHRNTIREMTDKLADADGSKIAATMNAIEEMTAGGAIVEVVRVDSPRNLDESIEVRVKNGDVAEVLRGRSLSSAVSTAIAAKDAESALPVELAGRG